MGINDIFGLAPARAARLAALCGSFAALPACGPQLHDQATKSAVARAKGELRYDAIIVGAGVAGLTAAKVLRGAGLDILVLEATDRIGGRAVTTDAVGKGAFEAPIDLGGAWIHGVRTNPLTPIAVGMGFRTTRTDVDAAQHLFFNGRFALPDEVKAFEEAYTVFEGKLEEAMARDGDDTPGKEGRRHANAGDYLDAIADGKLDEKTRRLLVRLVALNAGPLEGGTELAHSSVEDATDFISEDDDFVDQGYGTFVEKYGADVKPFVRLGSPVTKVNTKSVGVIVETDKGEVFTASKVLVTVSTGVLIEKNITFDPPLPKSKLDAIEALPMGVLDKVVLQFNTADVFPEQEHQLLKNTWLLYGGGDEQGKEDLAFVMRPLDTNIAVGFFGGAWAKELEAQPDKGKKAMVDIAMAAMTRMCKATRDPSKCNLERALLSSQTTAWHTDPWTLGAYSAALPGMAKMREELSEPVNHIVYFAGEACFNSTYNGSFAGAYNSALRAANAMIDCLDRDKRGEACVWEKMTRTAAP